MALTLITARTKHTAAIILTTAALCACSSVNTQAQPGQIKHTDLWSVVTGKTLTAQHASLGKNYSKHANPAWSDMLSGQLRGAPEPRYEFANTRPQAPYRAAPQYPQQQAALAPQPSFQNVMPIRAHSPKPVFKPFLESSRPIVFHGEPQKMLPQYENTLHENVVHENVRQNVGPVPNPGPVHTMDSAMNSPMDSRQNTGSAHTPDTRYESYKNRVSEAPLPQQAMHQGFQDLDTQTQEPRAQETQDQETQAQVPAAQDSSSGESLSYVKIGGGSQIADLHFCQKQAGNYYVATAGGGFTVEPKFDRCMRSKGYKTEAEAQAELEIAAQNNGETAL